MRGVALNPPAEIMRYPIYHLFVCLISFVLVNCSSSPSALTPTDLRCDGKVNPIGTGDRPRLTWRIQAPQDKRGVSQSAWQVMVARNKELLDSGQPDLWDSGRTNAARSPQIEYNGQKLNAGQKCYWKVRFWDTEGTPSSWSEISSWEVAPVQPEDWRGARWIDDGKSNPTRDEDFYKPDPAPLMRREFTLSKPVTRARLHITGLGLSYPSINGQRLSDHTFDPPWTDFRHRILFRTHDVTHLLKPGENCIGITLGNGWYNPLPLRMWGRRNIREALLVGRPKALAYLTIDHPDGPPTVVTTGPQWKTTEGPTLRNSIYLGEVRDARQALPGWDQPGFDDSQWRPVRDKGGVTNRLEPLTMHPVRLTGPMEAKAITSPATGVHIVDFGTNFTGLPEIDLHVPEGTKITFRFGELLNPDGTLNTLSSVCGQIKGMRSLPDGTEQPMGGPGAPEIAWQQNIYIARGGGPERYRPDFTFHGFRYMEITGLPAAPGKEEVRAYQMGTGLAAAGSFSSSLPLLNRIQEVVRQTFLTNVVTVQSDCPHRERFGYGGDIVATSEAYLMNFDMAGFYAKTVRDWADGALPDGRLPDTAPFVGIDYCGVGWAMVHPLLLEQLYQHYGNRALIEEQLPVALRWLEAEAARRENNLVVTGLGDHEALIPSKGPELTTPMFIDACLRVARLARLVGENSEADQLETWAGQSSEAWAERFLDPETGRVGKATQSIQTFALGFGHLDAPVREKVFDRLVDSLTRTEDSPRLTTGIYGTYLMLEELPRWGRHDLAHRLTIRDTFPSWGWMIQNDATTLWESWDGATDGSRSHNHPMFGSISSYFFRWLGGIQAASDAVGFDRILIRPQVVDDLEWVKCTHDSIRGRITSNWTTSNSGTEFEIIIPPDTTATIVLPAAHQEDITEGGKPLSASEGLEVIGPGPHDTTKIHAISGHYRFSL